MYAIVEVGAKQYNVKKDDIIEVEKQDTLKGKEISLNKVVLACKSQKVDIGQPYLKGVLVHALVLEHIKAAKVISFKYRRRKSKQWRKGHRQQLTRLKIKDIEIA